MDRVVVTIESSGGGAGDLRRLVSLIADLEMAGCAVTVQGQLNVFAHYPEPEQPEPTDPSEPDT